MSHFICAYKSNAVDINAFDKIVAGIEPSHLRSPKIRIEWRSSHLAVYGNEKVIPDIVIHDEKLDSWLVIIGTPLVCLKSKEQEQMFLAEFLAEPAVTLREKIDGHFAVFAYDSSSERLIAASDFNTTTPIFYALTPNGVFFSSHELSLARFLKPEIDPFGFSQLIQLGVTWSSHTRFQNIYKMLPCQILVINNNKDLHTESYWRPQHVAIWSGNFDDQMEKWLSLLNKSVLEFYQCSDYKPVICDFTAGEDARLILAQCHALGIPFKAHVTGLTTDIDVIVARNAARKADFILLERQKVPITEEELLDNASNISVDRDGYQDLFAACVEFATDFTNPIDDYNVVKYCGAPGGEAFRGSYYLRGKALFPAKRSSLDYKFFTKMKYFLDYHPGLLKYSDDDFLLSIYGIVEDELEEVKDFPIGTQIDHMLRVFQTCFLGLRYKNPLYLPFATNQMTRSIYCLSPSYKRGGRLTKACTEVLFPQLALVKTQNGVPTIRRTIVRLPLFLPEYMSVSKKIYSGAVSRLFKWKQDNKWYSNQDLNAYIYTALLNTPPYSNWFSSSEAMITGHLYTSDILNSILAQAKTGSCRCVPTLGRIINQELAFRWVYREKLS